MLSPLLLVQKNRLLILYLLLNLFNCYKLDIIYQYDLWSQRYSKENYEHHAEEKAPTTEEEFNRVAEEMAEEKEQQNGMNSNFEQGKENSHNKDDDSEDQLKTNPQSQISS